jgi:hypothetical protein
MTIPRIPIPDLHWYASQLLRISLVLDRGAGQARCRELGEAIFREFDHPGMVAVCEFVSRDFDRQTGSHIEAAWDGIGKWRG